MSTTAPLFAGPIPKIRRIEPERPWSWLAKGWRDLQRAPAVSLAYGLLFTIGGFLILGGLWLLDLFYLILPVTAGFMLVGPVLAVGLYETSRRLELGPDAPESGPPSLAAAIAAIRRNAGQILFMGVALMLFLLVWIRLATLIFALFFSHAPPGPEAFMAEVFLSARAIPFLIVGTSIGAVLAALVFAISAVSIPMLLDRPETNVVTAIATSLEAVRRNLLPMGIWAALVALFTAAGLVTFYVGLIVALPLIGHATWHAYREVVVFEE